MITVNYRIGSSVVPIEVSMGEEKEEHATDHRS